MKTKPRNPFSRVKKDSTGGSRVLIGAYVPDRLLQELSANALYSGLSRSALIETALEYFMKNYSKSEGDIVTKLSRRAMAEWDSFRTVNSGKIGWDEREAFCIYRKTLLTSMKKKGLSEFLIYKIMERIR